jgi:hypothetical protein
MNKPDWVVGAACLLENSGSEVEAKVEQAPVTPVLITGCAPAAQLYRNFLFFNHRVVLT